MLEQLVDSEQPDYLTTYTRNPRILRMMQRAQSDVYPLVNDSELRNIATAMAHATADETAVYHIDRYSEAGLFQGDDPANAAVYDDGAPLKQHFTQLMSVRNALVVAARVRK